MKPTKPLVKRRFKTVYSLLKDPERWCKNEFFTTDDVNYITNKEQATRCCVLGAIAIVYGGHFLDAYHSEQGRKLSEIIATLPDITCYNSPAIYNSNHTHAELLALVKKAGI